MIRRNLPVQGEHTDYSQYVDTGMMRTVMQQVYLWMTMAMLTTALTAFITIEAGVTQTIQQNPLLLIVAVFGQLGLVLFLGVRVHKMAPITAITMFFIYSALMGVTLSLILLVYTTGSIVTAFISTAALFGAMSILGATTDIDLTKLGSILFVGLIGLLIAMLINMFLASSAMDFVISIAGVLIFTGLTAYDTQRIAQTAGYVSQQTEHAVVTRVSIMGALILYLDFINLFLFILRLVGDRR